MDRLVEFCFEFPGQETDVNQTLPDRQGDLFYRIGQNQRGVENIVGGREVHFALMGHQGKVFSMHVVIMDKSSFSGKHLYCGFCGFKIERPPVEAAAG
jgi:hypothetical protein